MASGRSRIDIWNSALDVLKEAPLNSPEDDDAVAKWLTRNYEQQRDYMLGRYYWKFAMTRVELTPATPAPAWGWSTAYSLPADCVRIVPPTVDGSFGGRPIKFEEESGQLLCNKTETLRLRYVRRVEEEGLFSNDFCEVLALRLALAMSHWMTGKQSMTATIKENYRDTLAEVKDAAAAQVSSDDYYDDEALDVRAI